MSSRFRTLLSLFFCTWLIGQFQPVGAQDDGARLELLEGRLSRVEFQLERLIQILTSHSGAESLQQVHSDLLSLSQKVREIRAEAETGPPTESQATPSTASVDTPPQIPVDEIVHVPYSGYMEMHVNHDQINPTTLDFHRFVLLFGHGFGERIRFWSELELEHAFVAGGEASGELELEQAYLDFLIDPRFNFRAGMVLTPMGIINERHEPPAFHGVERPFLDTVIIPSTWFGNGAGFVGDLGNGFHYKTYVMASLDGALFSAEEGLRDGRQKGFLENGRNLAWTSRLEYRPRPGLNLGSSFWTGETGFNFRDLDARLHIFEMDARYRVGRLEGRAQFVTTRLGQVVEMNRSIRGLVGSRPNIARAMQGYYLEGAGSLLPARSRQDLVAFYRYESFDTQHRMPAGFFPLEQFDRSAHIFGLSYFPHPDVAFKFDYNVMKNASEIVEALNRWNFGIGWWF